MSESVENRPTRDLNARFRVCLQYLQLAISPKSRNGNWLQQVGQVTADLANLNQTTETDFLAVGGSLMDLLTSSRDLHTKIEDLASGVSGEQVQSACEALLSVRDHVRQMQARSDKATTALNELQSSAGQIHARISNLDLISQSFHITAILARIEAAHLVNSQEEMQNLADHVVSCSEGIQGRASSILEAAASFKAKVSHSLAEVSRCDSIQQKELPTLLAAVNDDLETFRSQQQDIAALSARLKSDLDTITKDLAGIGNSIQSHDITRQQVEHIIEALAALVKASPKRAISPTAATCVKLQRALLKNATTAFVQATEKIDADLAAIGERVSHMVTASRSLLGLDQQQSASVFSQIEARLSEVLRTVNQSWSMERAARGTVIDLGELVTDLRRSVQELQTIEIQLSRSAINGAIAATQIGTVGEPLGVVAGAMQRLQMECAAHSREANAHLDAIVGVIASLQAGGGADSEELAHTRLLEDFNRLITELRQASVSGQHASANVSNLAETLSRNVEELRARSGIGATFSRVAEESGELLDLVVASAQQLWFAQETEGDSAVNVSYTMQSERDTHEAIMNGQEIEPATVTESTDDVEFF